MYKSLIEHPILNSVIVCLFDFIHDIINIYAFYENTPLQMWADIKCQIYSSLFRSNKFELTFMWTISFTGQETSDAVIPLVWGLWQGSPRLCVRISVPPSPDWARARKSRQQTGNRTYLELFPHQPRSTRCILHRLLW